MLSLTMQTWCQCYHWLCSHGVNAFIDYADSMSMLSLTMKTRCQCYHWLHRHGVNAIIDYADTVSMLSLTTQTRCQCYHWLRRLGVKAIIDFADTIQYTDIWQRHQMLKLLIDYKGTIRQKKYLGVFKRCMYSVETERFHLQASRVLVYKKDAEKRI